MDKNDYIHFRNELIEGEQANLKDFEKDSANFFEACLPIEEIARRGVDTMRYGPLKAIGLWNPKWGDLFDKENRLKKRPQFPLVRQHATPQGQVTDVFVPMLWKGKYLGTLALGVTPNKKALASAALTREVTIAVFISIWVLVILGAVFNALTITRPVRELVRGV